MAFSINFKSTTVKVGHQKLQVELAESEDQQEHGLMFRKKLKDNEGMLFVFKEEKVRRFWMKNTFIDLSIGYFDSKKTLVDIQDMKAVRSEMEKDTTLPVYTSSSPAAFALEVPLGWFKKHNINKGDKLVLE
jgi:hypothetical protein